MTVASTTTKVVCRGNGLTRRWALPFALPAEGDIHVFLTAPGEAPVQLSNGWRVEQNSVIYPDDDGLDPLPEGYTLTLRRWVPFAQPTALPDDGEFRASTLEGAYDNLEYQIQQLAEASGRAISAPVDDSLSAEELSEQIMENHERYEEIAGKHAETLAARDAAIAAATAAGDAEDQAQGAKESAQSAAAAAVSAMTATLEAAQVTAWDEDEDYDYPEMVCCEDGNTYRAIAHSDAGTYPPEAPDTWVCVTIVRTPGTYDFESGGTFNDALTAVVTGGTF